MSGTGAAPSLLALPFAHWQAAWPLDAALTGGAILYCWGAARVGRRWPLRNTAAFLAGLAVVAIALQSGVSTYDDRLLSAHMLQHMLLIMPAPLLLLQGRPLLLALRALPRGHRGRLVALLERCAPLGNPLFCVAVFSAVLLLAHLAPVYEATLRRPLLHELEHGLFLTCGLLLWWPLLDVDPLPRRRLGGLGRIFYMLAAMPAMALVGAWLNRAPSLVYPSYAAPARALGVSAVVDQQQAGALMWVGGSTFMVVVGLCAAMAVMAADERRRCERERRAQAALATSAPPAGRGVA